MSFNPRGLTSIAAVGGVTAGEANRVWFYVSEDSVSTVAASGYFNDAAKYLDVRDLILVGGGASGSVEGTVLTVASNDGSTVTTVLPTPAT